MGGGSTENFREVVEGYSDIIAYLHSATNEGQSAAIQEGKEKLQEPVKVTNLDTVIGQCNGNTWIQFHKSILQK